MPRKKKTNKDFEQIGFWGPEEEYVEPEKKKHWAAPSDKSRENRERAIQRLRFNRDLPRTEDGWIDPERLWMNPDLMELHLSLLPPPEKPIQRNTQNLHSTYEKSIQQRYQEMEEKSIQWKAIHAKLKKDMGL